jgi:hypothetical protein
MEKFWKWMGKNGYANIYDDGQKFVVAGGGMCGVEATKQMLIGYMMEYLDDVNIVWRLVKISTPYLNDRCYFFIEMHGTQNRYDWLVKKIESLEE